MKILILGSTGRLGQQLVNEAINRGHQINILVREGNTIFENSPSIKVFYGLPTDKSILLKSMENCEVLLSALNISRTSDFPFAPLRTPKDFLSKTAENIVELLPKSTIKRAIIVTAQGANETKKDIPLWFKWIIDYSNVKFPYFDHEKQERIFKQSNLQWTIVRPVGLINRSTSKSVIVSLNNSPKPKLTISRLDTAKFMLDEAERPQYLLKMVTISNA